MVKALFGTSALAGMVMLAAGSGPAYGETMSSSAVTPTLKIDGFTAINTYFVNQQRRENGRTGQPMHIGVDASNLFFSVMGKSASGVQYMMRITLETIRNTESVIDQCYLEFKSKMGTLQLGNIVGPEDTMIWDAGKVIGGTGAFDGGYNNVFNMAAGVVRGNDVIGDTGNATKIAYYSPEVWGTTIGAAFTPTTAHYGDGKLDTMTASRVPRLPGNRGLYDFAGGQPFDVRNLAIGFTHKREIGAANITLSGAFVTAKSYYFNLPVGGATVTGRAPMQNTKAYQLGFVFGYKAFRLGGGYLNNTNSHLPRTAGFLQNFGTGRIVNLGTMNSGNAGSAWNLGAGYTLGAYQLGASYQRTNRNTGNYQKAHSDFYTATVDVTPFQGLKIYTEVDYIRSGSNGDATQRENQMHAGSNRTWQTAVINNSGVLGIVGTKISF